MDVTKICIVKCIVDSEGASRLMQGDLKVEPEVREHTFLRMGCRNVLSGSNERLLYGIW